MFGKKFKMFAQFTKVEDMGDGTLKVSGVASSESEDSQGEVITAAAIKAALPDYMKFGAVREMHQSWAAGTALKAEVDADNKTQFEALVVDAEAVKKVQTETYKGFSVGGKITSRDPLNKNTITGIRLTEISLVDRPSNPDAVFNFGKVDDGPDLPATLGELRKGLWGVSRFADLLQSLCWLAQDSEDEAEWEGDASPLPAALGNWVAQGAELLQAMTAEEIQELIATLPKTPIIETITQAAPIEDLAKAGQKFSKATKAALAEIHKAMQDGCEKMAGLGYDKADDEEADKAAVADDLQKAEGAKTEALAKVTALEADLAKVSTERDDLQKRVKDLEAQPAPPKGALKVISKGDDLGNPEAEDNLKKQAEEIDKLPPNEQAMALVKAVHASNRTGGR